MPKRILNWHIPYPGAPLPAFYMERDYVPEKVRIYAQDAPSSDFEVDIRDDGATIFADRATSYKKQNLVYSRISYNTLATSTFRKDEIVTGTSGAKGYVVTDRLGNMELVLVGTIAFVVAETIIGGTSGATAVVLSFYRGGLNDVFGNYPSKTTVALTKDTNLEEHAEDFLEDEPQIDEGSILTCHVIEMGGANNVTVQLELRFLTDDEEESD